MASGPEHPAAQRVTSRDEAERLVVGVLATMQDLQRVLEGETAQIRVGRLRDGLAEEARKSELAATYLRGLEAVKANAVALARFAPEAVERLRKGHAGFSRIVAANQAVIATARAVSESLIKSLSDEVNRAARPQTYAPGRPAAAAYGPRNEPLVISQRL